MSNKKITELTELTTPTTDDVLPLVDIATNATKKAQLGSLPISSATQTALDAKQATLVSGTNIKTINSTSLLGSGDISLTTSAAGTSGQIQFNDSSAFGADSNLFWDNTNKRLGVGTSSPAYPLHNNGNSLFGSCLVSTRYGFSNDFILAHSSVSNPSTSYAIQQNQSADTFINTLSSRGVYFSESGNSHSLIKNSSWGIGTTTPTARLQVKGSGSTSATTSLLVQNSSGTELFKVQDDGRTSIGQQSSVYPNIGLSGIYGGLFLNAGGQIALRSGGADIMSLTASLNVGIGTTSPNTSAKLDISSTTQGFLPPRMTTTQKNAISSPAAGLQVYDSTTNRASVYSTAWENVITETNGSPNSVYKLWSGSAAQYAALTPDSSTLYLSLIHI